jgi:hypothetical protein
MLVGKIAVKGVTRGQLEEQVESKVSTSQAGV